MHACFNTIAEYMEPKEVMKLRRKFVKRFFPRTVEIHGLSHLCKFHKICNTFDTSRLEEVRIVIGWEPQIPDDVIRVPSGVSKVSLDVNRVIKIEIPNTVEELTVVKYPYRQRLHLPDSIRKLTLEEGFNSIVSKWSENLEELRLDGWCTGNGRTPVPINYLPNNITHMTLDTELDIEINHWPEQLEELVLEGSEASMTWPHTHFTKYVNVVTSH
jgi:hypothetical protein